MTRHAGIILRNSPFWKVLHVLKPTHRVIKLRLPKSPSDAFASLTNYHIPGYPIACWVSPLCPQALEPTDVLLRAAPSNLFPFSFPRPCSNSMYVLWLNTAPSSNVWPFHLIFGLPMALDLSDEVLCLKRLNTGLRTGRQAQMRPVLTSSTLRLLSRVNWEEDGGRVAYLQMKVSAASQGRSECVRSRTAATKRIMATTQLLWTASASFTSARL